MKYTGAEARKDIPTRQKQDNKTRGGKVLILAGSKNLWGAALLCAEAASRVGCGYVYVYTGHGKPPLKKHPDFIFISKISKKNFKDFSAVAIGPGFQHHAFILKWIRQLKSLQFANVVLDAEAINALATLKKPLRLPPSWILTPHEGELARLLGVSSQKIRQQRRQFVVLAQKRWGCHILLKGYQTLIASQKSFLQISSGNPALAKAGTGDVLTGMIAGFLSQGLPAEKATALAAFIHGKMADDWLGSKKDVLSLRATDLLEMLPSVLYKIRARPQK